MGASQSHCLRTRPRLLKLRLVCLRASNYDPSPSDKVARQVSNLLWGVDDPLPGSAALHSPTNMRRPHSETWHLSGAWPAAPHPGTRDSQGREKRPYLSTGSRFRQQYEPGGAALPVESRGRGSGSQRAAQPLDGKEHVGAALSSCPETLWRRFVKTRGVLDKKAYISL